MMNHRWIAAALALAAGAAGADTLTLTSCNLPGVALAARCGVLARPLDPSQPKGLQIDLHVAVLPAVARNKAPDPVLVFAGGPGQSAIDLAPAIQRLLARFGSRRDIVLIDQRGTGRSAPLRCDSPPFDTPLKDHGDAALEANLARCRTELQQLPWGDLRQYTTPIASADVEAMRLALGLGPVNLVGVSYGTRAALDYMRLYPGSVRRAVLDGVAPPDMVLPLSFSADAQSALDALLAYCAQDAACTRHYPNLRTDWQALLARLPQEVGAINPGSGASERFTLTRETATGLVRTALYSPVLASALPLAITRAAQGELTALVGLAAGMGGPRGLQLALGMHFSVVCAEDLPRLGSTADRAAPDFGQATLAQYRRVCADWPRGTVPAAFYSLPRTTVPTLLLSGAIDPATPPRHGARVAQALGPQAVHVVAPNTGHGVMQLACIRDAVYRFVNEPDAAKALASVAQDAGCVQALPRPPVLLPQVARPQPARNQGDAK
ncbi:MAG: alpha/beta hydrolase [Proteobacteria bacterium]|nr:alpha/beta hydrolase [Pseudomonadota bacterium]